MILPPPSSMTPHSLKYLDAKASQQEMYGRMDAATRAEWEDYGHLRVEPAFQDRVFVVYESNGKTGADAPRPPKILAMLRIMSFRATDESGCCLRLLNDTTNESIEVGHVPIKVFGYPVFMAIPVSFALRWDAHEHGGKLLRTLSYVVFVKARNRSTFHNRGNVYLETANTMRDLFPNQDLKLEM